MSLLERLSERCLDLCKIYSEIGFEEEIADHVVGWAKENFSSERWGRWRNGVYVKPVDPDKPYLLLVGHLDTVKPSEDQDYKIDVTRVYGCGSSDMKAGVAVMMELLRDYPDGQIGALFYDQEEGDLKNNGLLPLLEAMDLPKADFALVLEPTSNEIQAGAVGSINVRLRVMGKRAHSARPWQGDNALYHTGKLWDFLRDFGRKPVEIQGLTFYEVLHATQIETSNSRNVIPGHCDLVLNYRFAPDRSLENAKEQLNQWLEPFGELEFLDWAEPGLVQLDHLAMVRWSQKLELKIEPKQAWTDVAQLTKIGIPAVNFGPGEPSQAHQSQEWVESAKMVDNYLAIESWIKDESLHR